MTLRSLPAVIHNEMMNPEEVLSVALPAAMLEDVFLDNHRVEEAFDFMGEPYALHPKLLELNGGLVFQNRMFETEWIWRGVDGSWRHGFYEADEDGDDRIGGNLTALLRLPPRAIDDEGDTVGRISMVSKAAANSAKEMQVFDTLKGTDGNVPASFPIWFGKSEKKRLAMMPDQVGRQWEVEFADLDPPLDFEDLYLDRDQPVDLVMDEPLLAAPGDHFTVPRAVCRDYLIRIGLSLPRQNAAKPAVWCLLANSERRLVKVLGGTDPKRSHFGQTVVKTDHPSYQSATGVEVADTVFTVDFSTMPSDVHTLYFAVTTDRGDLTTTEVIDSFRAKVSVVSPSAKLNRTTGQPDKQVFVTSITPVLPFGESQPTLVFLQVSRPICRRTDVPNAWQFLALDVLCKGRSPFSKDMTDALGIEGFFGDKEDSRQCRELETRTRTRGGSADLKGRSARAQVDDLAKIARITPFFEYCDQFVDRIYLIRGNAHREERVVKQGAQALKKELDSRVKRHCMNPLTMVKICEVMHTASSSELSTWMVFFSEVTANLHKYIRDVGKLASLVKLDVVTKFEDAQGSLQNMSGRTRRVSRGKLRSTKKKPVSGTETEDGKPHEIFKKHLKAVLDDPLQTLVTSPSLIKRFFRKGKGKFKLDDLTALLDNTDWWFTAATVQPVQEAYTVALLEEIKEAKYSPDLLAKLRADANQILEDDKDIYKAHTKKEKHSHGFEELSGYLEKLQIEVRGWRNNEKPKQPVPPEFGTVLSLTQAKSLGAKAAHAYKHFVENVLGKDPEVKGCVAATHLAPMKGSFRMLQKAIFNAIEDAGKSGTDVDLANFASMPLDFASVCDVNRGLIEAKGPENIHKIVVYLKKLHDSGDIDIVWMKDRMNHPTDAGWCDVLLLFSVKNTGGYINELQIAFETLHTARKGGAGHAAYAAARNKIEVIQAAGGMFMMQSAEHDVQRYQKEIAGLTNQLAALQKRFDKLQTKYRRDKNRTRMPLGAKARREQSTASFDPSPQSGLTADPFGPNAAIHRTPSAGSSGSVAVWGNAHSPRLSVPRSRESQFGIKTHPSQAAPSDLPPISDGDMNEEGQQEAAAAAASAPTEATDGQLTDSAVANLARRQETKIQQLQERVAELERLLEGEKARSKASPPPRKNGAARTSGDEKTLARLRRESKSACQQAYALQQHKTYLEEHVAYLTQRLEQMAASPARLGSLASFFNNVDEHEQRMGRMSGKYSTNGPRSLTPISGVLQAESVPAAEPLQVATPRASRRTFIMDGPDGPGTPV